MGEVEGERGKDCALAVFSGLMTVISHGILSVICSR